MKIANPNMTVAIVNHNTRDHLAACLRSVLPEQPAEIVVVDNASTDGSAGMVEREFPEVTLVRAPNEGYGAGANVAFRHTKTPYVLLLNSDTRLHAGTLEGLARYLDQHERVGMVGPKLVNPDGTLQQSVFPTPSPAAELILWTSLRAVAARIPPLRAKYYIDWPHNRAEAVGWIVGAALAIRLEGLNSVGGFDTSYFMYSEEIDLAYSLQRAGWEVHFTPAATITHYGKASTQAYRAEMIVRLCASSHLFYRKHFSRSWQRQLKIVFTYHMVRNLLRDRWRLLRSRCPEERAELAQDVAAWQQVLRLTWASN